MKKIIILFFTLIFCNRLSAQSAYVYNENSLFSISVYLELKHHNKDSDFPSELKKFIKNSQPNKFVEEFNKENKSLFTNSSRTSKGVSFGSGGDSKPIDFSFNFDNLTSGFVKFLYNRAKEELMLNFLQQFKEYLTKDEIKALFPNTTSFFSDLEPTEFNSILTSLREAFQEDIKNYPNGLHHFIKTDFFKRAVAKNENCKLIIPAVEIIYGLHSKNNFDEIMSLIVNNSYIKDDPSKVAGIFKSFFLVTDAIKVTSYFDGTDTDMLSDDIASLSSFITDDVRLKDFANIFFGLIYDRNSSVFQSIIKGTSSLADELYSQINNTSEIRENIKQFTNLAGTIKDFGKQFKNYKNKPDKNVSDYLLLLSSLTDLFKTSLDGVNKFSELNIDVTNLKKITDLCSNGIDIYGSIKKENYSLAIIKASIYIINSDVIPEGGLKKEFIKYSNFILAVGSAKDDEEVSSIIESIVLPAGSSSIKKTNSFTIELNSYLGANYSSNTIINKDTYGSFGYYAPLGINFSGPIGKSSVSLFLQLADFGSIVNYNFNNSDNKEIPKPELINILAPGVYVIYGFPKPLPLSLGVGLQYNPAFRKLTEANIESTYAATRWGLFLGVDIPLINFYINP